MHDGPAWYEDQPFGISERVTIIDAELSASVRATAGRVVGYDASGPQPGESFIRVLVLVDDLTPRIEALPPQALQAEDDAHRRSGLAQTMLVELRQRLSPTQFDSLLQWLQSPACAKLLADPFIERQHLTLGHVRLPGFLLSELVRLSAAEHSHS